jgi:putative hydrolase of the HAD superfamily
MIENIVFDLGNVLINFEPETWLNETYGDKESQFLYREFCLSPLWEDLDKGTRTLKEVEEILCCKFPEKESLIKDCTARYFGMLTPIPENIKVLKKLSEQNLSLYYLTNYHADAFQYALDNYPWFSSFKGGICSAHCHLVKPSLAIYRLLCRDMNFLPENSLFLDDTVENTKAADAEGFHTIVVKSETDLMHEIELKLK